MFDYLTDRARHIIGTIFVVTIILVVAFETDALDLQYPNDWELVSMILFFLFLGIYIIIDPKAD